MKKGKTDQQTSESEHRFGISGGSVISQDLNQLLVRQPESTFYLKVAVDQPELNLERGDILMVDRSLTPRKGELVVVTDEDQFHAASFQSQKEFWGLVTFVIHQELNR